MQNKKSNLIALILIAALCFVAGCSPSSGGSNYSDEMKIAYGRDLSEYGADSIEREGDHEDSPYYSQIDPYNMESTDTLTILPHFKTIQQTDERTCALACVLMVMDYFDRADGYDEFDLLMLHPQGEDMLSTSLPEAIEIFDQVGGFDLTTTRNYDESLTLAAIQQFLKADMPVMVCWNDWGGHWQVIIGYDTMGTESEQDDVLIVADPYDTTDHNQDGYGIYPALRFYYNFSTYTFFHEEDGNDQLFVAVKPA